MTDEKLRVTIKKLLNLAMDERTPPEEADTALKKATMLMAKNDIDWASVQTVETIKSNMAEETCDFFYQKKGSRTHWESYITGAIAKAFGCESIMTGFEWEKIAFLGQKRDVDDCIYFFEYLQGALARKIRVQKFTIQKDKESYGRGLAVRVSERLVELYEKKAKVVESECKDLMVVKTTEVADFFDKKHPSTTKTKYSKPNEKFGKGYEDGAGIGLHRGVGHDEAAGNIT